MSTESTLAAQERAVSIWGVQTGRFVEAEIAVRRGSSGLLGMLTQLGLV